MNDTLKKAKKAFSRLVNGEAGEPVAKSSAGPGEKRIVAAPRKQVCASVASRRPPIKEIDYIESIPKHKGILILDPTAAAAQLKYRDYYVLLDMGGKKFWALAIDQYFQNHHFLTAIEKAETAGLSLAGRGRITVACLQQLNQQLENSAASHQKKEASQSKDDRSRALFLLEAIVKSAIEKEASDIHVCIREPKGPDTGTGEVKFRIHGILKRQGDLYTSSLMRQMINNAYTSTTITDEQSRDKDQPVYTDRRNLKAMMRVDYKGEKVSLRFQQIVAHEGFDGIWRILRSKNVKKLASLGYEPSQQHIMELATRSSTGITLIIGVTGSGKTTTLMSMLDMDPEGNTSRKVFTAEDPPEYMLANTTRVCVQRSEETEKDDKGSPFLKLMRDLMRADPDVLMLGEVRDTHSGRFAQAAVQSGHAVYGTLHGNSAVGAFSRLSSDTIGIDRDTLCMPGFITLLVYQRLLRVLCQKCKLPALGHIPETMIEEIVRFGINPEKVFTRNKEGCEHCNFIGATGRTVCAEVIQPDRDLLQLFHSGEDWKAEEHWRRQRREAFDHGDMRGKTAFEHAVYKMSKGLIDPMDIDREISPFETYHIFPIKTGEEGAIHTNDLIAAKKELREQQYQAAAKALPASPH